MRFHPPNYNSNYGGNALQVFNKAVGRMYGDIMVMRVGDVIRVYQSACTSGSVAVQNGDREADATLMKEIVYYGAHNTNFAVAYDMATNLNAFTEVRFKIENEEMKVYMYGLMAMPQEQLLCDFSTIKAAGGGKNNVTYPIHQAKWNLYPVMYCRGLGNHLELNN